MQAVGSEGSRAPKPQRHRLLHGPDWVSPYEVRRAALRRVTRSEPVEFRSSRGVVIVSEEPLISNVVDLTARRQQRAIDAGASVAHHPSRWQPA